jgi:hypothetical protein
VSVSVSRFPLLDLTRVRVEVGVHRTYHTAKLPPRDIATNPDPFSWIVEDDSLAKDLAFTLVEVAPTEYRDWISW